MTTAYRKARRNRRMEKGGDEWREDVEGEWEKVQKRKKENEERKQRIKIQEEWSRQTHFLLVRWEADLDEVMEDAWVAGVGCEGTKLEVQNRWDRLMNRLTAWLMVIWRREMNELRNKLEKWYGVKVPSADIHHLQHVVTDMLDGY